MDTREEMERYEWYLRGRGFSPNTVTSYVWVADYFTRNYEHIDYQTLGDYRSWLVKTFKPGTANQRVQAINCYLGFVGKDDLKLRTVRVQQRTYVDNTIRDEDYRELLRYLLAGSFLRDYHAVRIMATTGVRVSELLRLTVEDIARGYLDVCSKGTFRRIHIPSETCEQAMVWLREEGRATGPVLLNRFGAPISCRGLSQQLKQRADECSIDRASVHPHAFRHLFARRFLEAGGDLALLADLLGHSSVETTRIYLRQTSSEQHEMLDRLVSW